MIIADIAYIDSSGAPQTMRAGTQAYASLPSDSPASTAWLPYITDAGQLEQMLFGRGDSTAGDAGVGFGQLLLANADGSLDAWQQYEFGGQKARLRWVEPGAALSTALDLYTATMDEPEFTPTGIKLRLRDALTVLDTPAADRIFGVDAAAGAGLARVNGTGLRSYRPAGSVGAAITLGWTPTPGNHLLVAAVLDTSTPGSVTVQDNQGNSWAPSTTVVALDATRALLVGVLPSLVTTNGDPWTVTIYAPGGKVEAAIEEISGPLFTSPGGSVLVRTGTSFGPVAPAVSPQAMSTNALPRTGDYALALFLNDAATGTVTFGSPAGWTAMFTNGDASASVGGVAFTQALSVDGAVSISLTQTVLSGSISGGRLIVLSSSL